MAIASLVRQGGAALASLVIVLSGVLIGGASPAQAASGCGSKCDGKNPQTYVWEVVGPAPGVAYTCGQDAVTPSVSGKTFKKYVQGLYIELRYSPSCRTAWARTDAVNWGM